MKAKLNKWIRSPSRLVAIILALACVIMMLIDCLFFKTEPHSYLSGSITEVIGIIITVIFVQMLFDRNNERNQRIDEEKKILRANKALSLLIKRYENFLFCMTTDNSKLSKGHPSFENDYSITDIGHCHQPCLLMDYSHSDSCVSLFFRNERELRNMFISMTQNIEFSFHSEVSDLILNYIEDSYNFDSSDAILSNEKLYVCLNTPEQKPMASMIRDGLKSDGQKYFEGLSTGESKVSNIMYPYVRLYILTQRQRDILTKYRNYIKKLEK